MENNIVYTATPKIQTAPIFLELSVGNIKNDKVTAPS
jgi:hypothetical protein